MASYDFSSSPSPSSHVSVSDPRRSWHHHGHRCAPHALLRWALLGSAGSADPSRPRLRPASCPCPSRDGALPIWHWARRCSRRHRTAGSTQRLPTVPGSRSPAVLAYAPSRLAASAPLRCRSSSSPSALPRCVRVGRSELTALFCRCRCRARGVWISERARACPLPLLNHSANSQHDPIGGVADWLPLSGQVHKCRA